jgi:DNA-binding SARP family transcriptional activator/tetratricopeptide (TPR) repeat protein
VVCVRFDVLGPLRLCLDGDEIAVTGTLRRNLLAMLLVRVNRPVPADVLVDALWGERAGDAMARLHVQVHRLRGVLDEPERLSFDSSGYCLRVGADESDVGRFDSLVDQAADADPRQAVVRLREALGLWRGAAYDGVDLPRVVTEARRLTERRLNALEALYTAELRDGRHAAVTSELGDAVRQHPLRERLHALLMTALYRSGRQAEALAAYRDAREILVEELGLEPGPELRRAERAILDGVPIEIDQPMAPRAVPSQLPQRPADFVGRAAQLSALDGLVRHVAPVALATVVGGSGVGKTSLALSWAHRVKAQFPDGQLYVDLRGYGPDQPALPEDVLGAFLRAFGVDGTAIPEDPAERAARFRTLADGKRLLVVLDNARSSEQVRPLLPGSETCRVVVTSRDSLAGLVAREGAHRIHLDRMTDNEATELLVTLLGDRPDAETGAVVALAARCAGLPLALRIAAERLRSRPHYRVADLVAELSDEHARLDVLDSGEEYTSVRAVFAASYDNLPTAAARLFRLFGIHPGYDVDAIALAALADAEPRETRRLIDILVRAHLAEESAPGRYAMHDLLWSYATDLAVSTDPPEARRSAIARLLDHYLHTASRAAQVIFPDDVDDSLDAADAPGTPDYDAGIHWLDTERVNLLRGVEVARAANRPAYITDLSRVLSWYLDVSGRLDDAWRLHNTALTVATERQDRVAEATALRGLGLVHFRGHRYAESASVTEPALALYEASGAVVAAASTHNALGVLYAFMGRADDAVRSMRLSIDMYRTIDRDSLRACRPLIGLGQHQRRRGDIEAARQHLHEAYAIAETGGLLVSQAHASYGLTGVYRDIERFPEAFDFARRTVRLARRARFRFLEGLALQRLGTIHARLGEFDEAQRRHGEALDIGRTTGSTQLEAIALNGTAETAAAAGMPDLAADAFRAALAVAVDRGAEYEQARAHAGLGDAHESLGEHDEALQHWQRALDLYRTLHVPAAEALEAKLTKSR